MMMNSNDTGPIGAFSYDFATNEWGYLGKKGNTPFQNAGYFIGLTANIQDGFAFNDGTMVDALAKKRLFGHAEARDVGNKDAFVSVIPEPGSVPEIENESQLKWELRHVRRQMKGDIADGINYKLIDVQQSNHISTRVYNVNRTLFTRYTSNLNSGRNLLNTGRLTYGLGFGCINFTSRALLFSGVFNFNAFLPLTPPLLLNLELGVRQAGLTASPYFYSGFR